MDELDELFNESDNTNDISYEVWAIGYDEEDECTDVELQLGTFADPDEAAAFAKMTVLADIVNLAAEDEYDGFDKSIHTISIEVETVIQDADLGAVNSGTIFKKQIKLFEDVPDYVVLSERDYIVIEDTGYIQITRRLGKEYNKNDVIAIIFEDEEEPRPIEFKVISKTTDGYVCEFV